MTRTSRVSPRRRGLVLERDGGCVLTGHEGLWGRCRGPLTMHHRRKVRYGGSSVIANLLAVCRKHNAQIEAQPELARVFGSWLIVYPSDPEWTQLSLRVSRQRQKFLERTGSQPGWGQQGSLDEVTI